MIEIKWNLIDLRCEDDSERIEDGLLTTQDMREEYLEKINHYRTNPLHKNKTDNEFYTMFMEYWGLRCKDCGFKVVFEE